MKKLSILLGGLAVALGGVMAHAQIKRLNLEQMTTLTDNAILGTIKASRVIDVGNEVDGFGLYYTILTIEGESLYTSRATTVDVAVRGGWLDKERGIGSWDSESPTDDETALGKKVVAYYRWVDSIGGGVGANILYASHGSLFRTVEGPNGTVILGRGEGYAINKNTSVANLRKATATILQEAAKKQNEAGK